MKKILMALIAAGSMAVAGHVYAGGTDVAGEGFYCYLYGEHVDFKFVLDEDSHGRVFFQFMTNDEDPQQMTDDVLKKLAKMTSKHYTVLATIGNLPIQGTTWDIDPKDPKAGGRPTPITVCGHSKVVPCDPKSEKCPAIPPER